MTATPTKTTINIEAVLEELPSTEEETRFLLTSAETRLGSFIDSGDYEAGRHDLLVSQYVLSNPTLGSRYEELVSVYTFIEQFTLGEFLSFSEAHSEFLQKKTGRKRGRPAKTESDQSKQRQVWAQQIEQCFPGLRFNVMEGEYQYLRADPKTGRMEYYSTQGDDLNLLSNVLSQDHGFYIPVDEATRIFKMIARREIYYPQQDMLNQARERYPDLTVAEALEVFKNMGTYLFGHFTDEPQLDNKPLRDVALMRFMRGMAHLARHPGEILYWMPIIIGAQGCGKSAFCKYLVPPGFRKSMFSEMSSPISVLEREPYRLHVAFLLEIPEIDEQLDKSNGSVEKFKKLVTADVDRCRMPYAAQPIKLVRHFALVGTSNQEDIFCDGTGERRYLPIQIPLGHEVPWRELESGDLCWKLWAAADVLAENFEGDEVNLRDWSREEHGVINSFQQRYTQADLWETKILNYVRTNLNRRFTTADLLESIAVDISKMSSTMANRRVNDVIQRHYGISARKVQITLGNGKRTRGWEINSAAEDVSESVSTRIKDLGSEKLNDPEKDF